MAETQGISPGLAIPGPDIPRLDITVAIPTYNGAKRLPLLLERLQAQVNTAGLRWEVLIVDNNSQDNTAEIIRHYQALGRLGVPLRSAFEPRQGAAFARQTAIQTARGEWVGFLDDDSLPEMNWVAEAVDFGRRHGQVGAFSGRIEGCYETTPPEGFEQIKAMLAMRDFGPEVIPFEPKKLRLPPAASLVIRRQAWIDCVPAEPALTGPTKPALAGKLPAVVIQGEDYEPLLYLDKGNWQILYNPALKTYHQIARQRFERQYLLTLARGCGLSTCQLALIADDNWCRPLIALRVFVGSLRRLTAHLLHRRGKAKTDLAAAVQLQFHLGSLLSPLYVRRWVRSPLGPLPKEY